MHGLIVPLELGQQFVLGATTKHLRQEDPAGGERVARELGRDLEKVSRAQVVRLAMSRGGGRHIRHHEIGCVTAKSGKQCIRRVVVQKILEQENDTGKRFDLQIVDTDNQGASSVEPVTFAAT